MITQSETMTIWIIEPHDPLIVRDGRPFGPNPGARAKSLAFPFPSTTTGGIRTRAGLNKVSGIFERTTDEDIKLLKDMSVYGPLLVQLTLDEQKDVSVKWLIPAPLDALLLPPEETNTSKAKTALVQQLIPLALPHGAMTDMSQDTMTEGDKREGLMLVGMPEIDQRKPITNAPQYWHWETFQKWLLNPSQYKGVTTQLSELGLNGPQREQRMHVSIDNKKAVSYDGMLFETSGLEFTALDEQEADKKDANEQETDKRDKRLQNAQRLALAVAVNNNHTLVPALSDGLASFGGERRIVSWRKSDAKLPVCDASIINKVVEQKFCRVFLLTPAYFKNGYYPTWLLEARDGVRPKMKAIATQRPQVVSGWDLAERKPKPTKRLAQAGTVFFLSLKDCDSEEAIRDWLKSVWMHCISDELQDQKDGFGLAVVGTWYGQPEAMKGQQS